MITSLSYQDSDPVDMGLREGDLAAPAEVPGLDLPMANQVLIVVPSITAGTGMAAFRKPADHVIVAVIPLIGFPTLSALCYKLPIQTPPQGRLAWQPGWEQSRRFGAIRSSR